MRICFAGVGRDEQERAAFDLFPVEDVPNAMRLAEGGSVLDAATYELCLHLSSSLAPTRAFVGINGGEPVELVHTKTSLVEGEADCAAFRMSLVDHKHPGEHKHVAQYFKMTYGFARVEVELFLEGAPEPLLLTTRDIPCRSQNPVDSANVEGMLSELLDSDDVPSSWMFGCARDGSGPYSIMDGQAAEHSAKSITSMVELIERSLAEYERHRSFFRSGAHSRIVQQHRTVPLGAVRNAGRNELMWLSRNTGVLAECPEREGVYYNGRWYMPRKVETSVRVRTYNSYENQRILGFLTQIARVSSLLHTALERASHEVRSMEDRLQGISSDASMLPALTIVRAYATRERAFLDRLDTCASRARELRRVYGAFMPDVQEAFGYSVRRTKIFTEVHPYMRIFGCMQEWLAFGDFSLAKEGLALQAAKLDKLYEYFVLHRMLGWLHARGFAPAGPVERAVRCGSYQPEGFFKPETGVASVYELERCGSDGVLGVKLYYQPIFRSNMLEEEGVVLHRLSYKEGVRMQNYWTPDYLIEVTDPVGVRTYHVVDAKYRKSHELFMGYPKGGEFAECTLKYRMDVMGSSGERVSSVWLVAGKQKYAPVQYAESSPWAMTRGFGPRSGVAVLNAETDCLDAVFAEVFCGVASMRAQDTDDMRAQGAAVEAAELSAKVAAAEVAPAEAATVGGTSLRTPAAEMSAVEVTALSAVAVEAASGAAAVKVAVADGAGGRGAVQVPTNEVGAKLTLGDRAELGAAGDPAVKASAAEVAAVVEVSSAADPVVQVGVAVQADAAVAPTGFGAATALMAHGETSASAMDMSDVSAGMAGAPVERAVSAAQVNAPGDVAVWLDEGLAATAQEGAPVASTAQVDAPVASTAQPGAASPEDTDGAPQPPTSARKFKRGHKKRLAAERERAAERKRAAEQGRAAALDNAAEKDIPAPQAPKPVKKASLPKQKAEKKRKKSTLFDLDEATRASIDNILSHLDDIEMAYNIRWAQRYLRLDRPLLRRRKPEGREAAHYEQTTIAGEECWLFAHWTPAQKNRAKLYAKTLEHKEEERDERG